MNDVAILSAGGVSYNLEVLLRNIPDYKVRYTILVDSRLCKDTTPVIDLCKQNGLVDFEVLDSTDMFDKFKQDIKLSTFDFFDSYTMSLNIIAQWYLLKYKNYDKVLFLDDDVILNNGIEEIFNQDHSMFYKFRLSAGPATYEACSKKCLTVNTAFADIFDYTFNKDTYKEVVLDTHINGGQRLYCKSDVDIEKYEYYLKRFFENAALYDIWENRRHHCSWYLDERFEGYFAWKTGIFNNDMAKYAYVEVVNIYNPNNGVLANMPKYKRIQKAVWHNATCGKKKDWISILVQHGLIK